MDTMANDDSSESDSNITTDGSDCTQYEHKMKEDTIKHDMNVVKKILNRQLFGRFTKNSKSKTEKIYYNIPERCNRLLSDVLPNMDHSAAMQHVYMGFTICGQYLLSYTWTAEENTDNLQPIHLFCIMYYLYVWRYAPGQRLTMVSKQTIFRHCRTQEQFLDVTFSQWPTDRSKVVAYGVNLTYPGEAYITVVCLPTLQQCIDCSNLKNEEETDLPCLKHLVTVDFMLNITSPYPVYNPSLHLAYPDHIVINTGHYLHILNVSYVSLQEIQQTTSLPSLESVKTSLPTFSDTLSEISEAPSEIDFPLTKPNLEILTNSKTNVVEAILQDFSEYDLENSECSKPFHELNISCEPLNVTGKNYYTNHIDSRYKILQNKDSYLSFMSSAHSSKEKQTDKPKIDKKIAEKAYEFTEENEKYEKLSSFRKKRLADKKYEFSEDNSENIIPFNLLRQERKYLYRSQNTRCIRSPDFFVSPRTHQGIRSPRSPMLSPNNRGQFSPSYRSNSGQSSSSSRMGQFSPSSPRNHHASLRVSPICRSPISPRDQTRKYNVYSPSHFDSDCSDSDSKFILRQHVNLSGSKSLELENRGFFNTGLLIVDGKKIEEKPRWIRKVVKRFCNLDFETASLVSDVQSRDEYLCIELPILVHAGSGIHIDAAPTRMSDELIGGHVKVTQKTFDLEQFCQRRAEKLCCENRLIFTHCEDYDIKIQHICPLSGDIVCTAEIKMGAVKSTNSHSEPPQLHVTNCMFVWNIVSDSYRIMESTFEQRLCAIKQRRMSVQSTVLEKLPQIHCKKVRDMAHRSGKSVQYLRDPDNLIQISLDKNEFYPNDMDIFLEDSMNSFTFNDFLSSSEDFFDV